MHDLIKQVRDVLNDRPAPTSVGQSRVIDEASHLFDVLRARGLIEPPRYKLAPLDSVPPKSYAYGATK